MRPLSMELPGKPEVDGMDWQGRDAFSEGHIWPGQSNPCGEKEQDRDATGRRK